MKRLLTVSGVLSWINLVVWGFIIVAGIFTVLLSMNIELFVFVFLLSSILLHSYASLKLRKSVKDPGVPLESQTSTGIRLTGVFTLFIGVMLTSQGIAVLQNIGEVTKVFQDAGESLPPAVAKKFNPKALAWEGGIFSIVLGICCAANAVVNFRMLRWYLFIRNNQQDSSK